MIKGNIQVGKTKYAPTFFLKLDLRQFHFVELQLYLNCKEEKGKQKNQR